jgi:hypothetical protein
MQMRDDDALVAAPNLSTEQGVRPEREESELVAPQASAGIAGAPEPDDAPRPSFVYALGRIDARYPSLGVEKEFAQTSALLDTTGLNERQILKKVISDEENRYLARSLCWLLLVGGIETYILTPRDPRDFKGLVDAYRADPDSDDVDVVIGMRGQIAPPDACNGVAVPIVAFDRLYSFTRRELVDAIPLPYTLEEDDAEAFRVTAGGVFDRIAHMADNAGATDAHRALNYLTVRYPMLYTEVAKAHNNNASLAGVDVRPSPLSGVRAIVEVIFSFIDRQTDVEEKQFARVDVTEEYPFLVTKLGPYFER